MRGVDNPRAFRHLVQFVDEDCALLCQVGHDVAVVHDLFAYVDGRAKGIECNLNDVDGSHNSGTEAARLEEKYPLSFRFVAALVYRDALKGGCSHVYQYTAFTPVAGTS